MRQPAPSSSGSKVLAVQSWLGVPRKNPDEPPKGLGQGLYPEKKKLFVVTLPNGIELNRNLAYGKVLLSLTF